MAVTRWLLIGATVVMTAVTPQQAAAVPHPSIALQSEASYQAAREEIKAKNYAAALPLLEELRRHYATEAEVHSLIGFAHRKLGRLEEALRHYETALSLDAAHPGANEYLGELYLQWGRLDQAEERLEVLRNRCGLDCEETQDLAESIAAFKSGRFSQP